MDGGVLVEVGYMGYLAPIPPPDVSTPDKVYLLLFLFILSGLRRCPLYYEGFTPQFGSQFC
jgi:hypothetical protein